MNKQDTVLRSPRHRLGRSRTRYARARARGQLITLVVMLAQEVVELVVLVVVILAQEVVEVIVLVVEVMLQIRHGGIVME
jgi:hypothetical protein